MKHHKVSRRALVKSAVMGAAAGALSGVSGHQSRASVEETNQLKVAGYAYDRVRSIQDGRSGLDGFNVSFHVEDIYRLNHHVFGSTQKYEVSEVGLIPYITKYANDTFRNYTLIPVFISRIFRHRNIFVRTDRGIEKPEDLRGKRVGTNGYGMSACTWIRGFLQDIHGIKPEDMHWVEAGGSSDKGKLNTKTMGKYLLPDDFPIEQGPSGVDESELIIAGDVDALITAITPKVFLEGHSKVKRLFPDFRTAEREYYTRTRVFPIMHTIAIRSSFAEANPDLPGKLFAMYSRAKQAAYDDLETTTSLKVTLPWVTQDFEDAQQLMGDNYWPYGIQANRRELDLVVRYTHEQGLAKRQLKVEEIFHPSTLELAEA